MINNIATQILRFSLEIIYQENSYDNLTTITKYNNSRSIEKTFSFYDDFGRHMCFTNVGLTLKFTCHIIYRTVFIAIP